MDEGDEQWSLSRFAPLMQEVLEDLAANKLNFDEYPYVQPPSSDSGDLDDEIADMDVMGDANSKYIVGQYVSYST